MAGSSELLELAQRLREERLFTQSEREQLEKLNQEVSATAEKLYHEAWIARQQRVNLSHLVLASKDVSRAAYCTRGNVLENVAFVDGYKHLSYHESRFGELLRAVRNNPRLVASCLDHGEKAGYEDMPRVVQTMLSAVYGHCTLQQDELFVLEVLQSLIQMQLVPAENPRRLLRRGSCMFSLAFKLFSESLFSAELFLTSALHRPTMQLLMEDEWFYDVDPDKALSRFPKNELLRRFGVEGSPEYDENMSKYREFVINKLVIMTQRFITSIKTSMHCFPQSLLWLVCQMYNSVILAGTVDADEARAMCADVLFAIFICPAICDPEPHGLTSDIPVSYVARHNLMQVAQILQVLAITRWDEIDIKVRDLYGRFEKHCMSSLLDTMLQNASEKIPRQGQAIHGLTRSAVLITPSELSSLVAFFRHVMSILPDGHSDKKLLEELMADLPAVPTSAASHMDTATPNGTPPSTPPTRHKRKGVKKKSMVSPEEVIQAQLDVGEGLSVEEDVLVIAIETVGDCPGLTPEEKVLNLEQQDRGQRSVPNEIIEKRTRFSVSHDQESIGGTSDYPEAISEAASVRSIGSVNLEDDDESLSDMVSANVSGRGTPNISGRDTPSSHADSHPDRETRSDVVYPNLPVTVQRPGREDVPDRFGKFDIRSEMEHDSKSTVSDTWSTDVLASDSEPPDTSQLERLEEVIEDSTQNSLLNIREVSEAFETRSESAWSTDVLASDTSERQADRLAELDTDEVLVASSSTLEQDEPDAGDEMSEGAMGGAMMPTEFVSPEDAVPDVAPGLEDNFLVQYRHGDADGRQRSRSTGEFISDQTGFLADTIAARLSLNIPTSTSMDDLDFFSSTSQPPAVETKAGVDASELSQALSLFDPLHTKKQEETDASLSLHLFDPLHSDKNNVVNTAGERDSRAQDLLVSSAFDGGDCALLQPSNSIAGGSGDNAETDVFANGLVDVQREDSGFGDLCNAESHSPDAPVAADDRDNHSNVRDSGASLRDSAASRSSSGSGESKCSADLDLTRKDTSQGAIPKTFKATVKYNDKDDPDGDMRDKKKSGIFRNLIKFKGPKRKHSKPLDKDDIASSLSLPRDHHLELSKTTSLPMDAERDLTRRTNLKVPVRPISDDPTTLPPASMMVETTDDILAKYRKKSNSSHVIGGGDSPDPKEVTDGLREEEEEVIDPPMYDPDNLETCPAFLDAKRKLRLVLGTADFHTLPWVFNAGRPRQQLLLGDNTERPTSPLLAFLKIQLAEAINLQDKNLIAQLHETIRCLRQFDKPGTKKLIRSLQEDYKCRRPYIAYLTRSRQGLLSTKAHCERLLRRIRRDKDICHKYFVSVLVRHFLEKKERQICKLIEEFQKLTVSDEKTDLVEEFLEYLAKEMDTDPVWRGASEQQFDDAMVAIERNVMGRIYSHAMYPNGDGDILRDQILHQHLGKLSKGISPNNKYLSIPRMYQQECPWPSAQAEIQMLTAYKTPKDKLQCVLRCAAIIMKLLSIANETSVPAADDFMPVMIFVLVKANPPNLLSTIQYVNGFYAKRLHGEEQYWWMQFCAAVEFVKTMEYSE